MKISGAINSVKNNFTKYIAKGVGAGALGLVAYDSHVIGKLQSDVYAKSGDADACMNAYSNTQYLTSPSMTTSKVKNALFNWEVESNVRHFVNSAIGYFAGFGSMLVDNVVPFGLGLGALLGKGKFSKGSAIGLGIYSVVKIIKDGFGFGHYNDLNRKY